MGKNKDFLIFFLITICIFSLLGIRKVTNIKKYGNYAIAKTTYQSASKRYSLRIHYDFITEEGIKYSGYMPNYFLHRPKNKVKCPGMYLVIYSTKNPNINILVETKEVTSDINLDSLNTIGVSQMDWNIYDF